MASSYSMLMVPLIIIACLGITFSASINTDNLAGNFTIIQNTTFPEPQATWYGETDLFGYFVAFIDFVIQKGGAFFNLVGILIIPVAIFSSVPILLFPYVGLYAMMGVGLYKVILPFVGR